jgi:hypothetical protein
VPSWTLSRFLSLHALAFPEDPCVVGKNQYDVRFGDHRHTSRKFAPAAKALARHDAAPEYSCLVWRGLLPGGRHPAEGYVFSAKPNRAKLGIERRIPLPQFTPRHYDVQAWTLSEARRFLDVKYQLGWRVVKMTPQPGGRKVLFLFEKRATSQRTMNSN